MKLKTFNVGFNQLNSFKELSPLNCNPDLTSIYLKGNFEDDDRFNYEL